MILSSLSLSLSLSSALLSLSTTVKFPERRICLVVSLILPSLCMGTVTQHPTIPDTMNIQLNSDAIINHNLDNTPQVSSKAKNQSSITQQYHCPPKTFRCGDGSCIPQDWINDGEADCHDLSDEKIRSTTKMIQSTMFDEITEYPTTMEEVFDDPFDHVVTFPSIDQFSFSIPSSLRSEEVENSHSSSNYANGCSNIIQTRVNQCSTDLTDWIENLHQIDLTNSSVLNDETRWRIMDQGCELLLEFRRCTETLNITACILPKSIELWNSIELYTCQLLLPSVKEYKNCFANPRNRQCAIQ